VAVEAGFSPLTASAVLHGTDRKNSGFGEQTHCRRRSNCDGHGRGLCSHREEVVAPMGEFPTAHPQAAVLQMGIYAPGLYEAARRLGLVIPDDLAVGAVNMFSRLDHMCPMLMSVTRDFGRLGRRFVAMARQAIEHGSNGPRRRSSRLNWP
jgi:DNA-binding LacI/PurR family transcriptional regulator